MEIDIIKQIVINETNVDLNDPKVNSSRKARFVDARMHYFRLMREYTNLSLAQIARTLKPDMNHATVLHALKSFDRFYSYYDNVKNRHDLLKSKIEFIKQTEQKDGLTFQESIEKLHSMEALNKKLLEENQTLLNKINRLNEQLKRQTQYLVGRGHSAT